MAHGDRRSGAIPFPKTFPRAAELEDPENLFNTRLTSSTFRAIDFAEGQEVPLDALTALVQEAVRAPQRR